MASDLIAIYGLPADAAFGHAIGYDDICGLILNLDRYTSRLTYAVARGTAIAGGAPVSAWLYDGVCQSPEEAADRAFRETCRRNERRARQMAKLGPAGFLMGAK